jgi:hypothetical protein
MARVGVCWECVGTLLKGMRVGKERRQERKRDPRTERVSFQVKAWSGGCISKRNA